MSKTKKALGIIAIMGVGVSPILVSDPASASDEAVVSTFDFPFPACRGVVAADNPFHVTTISDSGLPLTRDYPAGPIVISTFTDAGSYNAMPSKPGDQQRSGRYRDHYEAVATGAVTYGSAGEIATAGHLAERRDIYLWDGHRFFFHETWIINVDNYDETLTQPEVSDACKP